MAHVGKHVSVAHHYQGWYLYLAQALGYVEFPEAVEALAGHPVGDLAALPPGDDPCPGAGKRIGRGDTGHDRLRGPDPQGADQNGNGGDGALEQVPRQVRGRIQEDYPFHQPGVVERELHAHHSTHTVTGEYRFFHFELLHQADDDFRKALHCVLVALVRPPVPGKVHGDATVSSGEPLHLLEEECLVPGPAMKEDKGGTLSLVLIAYVYPVHFCYRHLLTPLSHRSVLEISISPDRSSLNSSR